MAHYSGLVTRPHSSRKPLSARAGKIALAACAVLLPRLALAQLAPYSNYDGQDLSNGDYADQNGSGSSFQGTNLRGANLFRANLNFANLTSADLTNANLAYAKLFVANLTNADLSGVNLFGADLSSSNISSAQVESAAQGDSAAIYGINLSNTVLPGVNLATKDLTGTNFSKSNLVGADLHNVDLGNAYLAGANLHAAWLRDANFTSANFSNADLSNALLALSDFTDADLVNANLSNADLRAANLTYADLQGANLNGAMLAPSMPMLPVINGAVVTVVEGSTVTTKISPGIDQGGTLVVDGTLNFTTLSSEGAIQIGDNGNLVGNNPLYGVNISGGSLSGTGTVSAFVDMRRATIDPGNGAPGTLTINNGLSFLNSTLTVNIASLSAHSVLNVTDDMQVFGNSVISINLQNGYLPFYGDTFEILHTNRISGFGTLKAPENWEFLSNGGTGTLRYTGSNFASVAVPEPGTFFLAGIAGLPLLYLLWSRRRAA